MNIWIVNWLYTPASIMIFYKLLGIMIKRIWRIPNWYMLCLYMIELFFSKYSCNKILKISFFIVCYIYNIIDFFFNIWIFIKFSLILLLYCVIIHNSWKNININSQRFKFKKLQDLHANIVISFGFF